MSLVMSSDNIVMSLWAEWPRNWFDCWQEQGIFLFSNHAHQLWVRSHPGSYLVGGMKLTTYHILHGSIHPLPLMPSWCGFVVMFSISWIVWKISPWLYLFNFLVVCGFELYILCFITLWSSELLHHAVYICFNISEELAACIFRLAWI